VISETGAEMGTTSRVVALTDDRSVKRPRHDSRIWVELGASDALKPVVPNTCHSKPCLKALVCVTSDAAVEHRARDYLRRYRENHVAELGDALMMRAQW